MNLLSVKKKSGSSVRAFVEPLEQRRLLAQTFSLFPDPGLFYGPIRPEPGPRAPSAAINIRKVASTVGPNIGIFDISFKDNHPDVERALWMGPTTWSTTGSKTPDFSQQRVEKLASYVRDGKTEPWTKQKVRQNAFTVLDFEVTQLAHQTPEFLADRLKWFKEAAPAAPVTSIGINIGAGNYNRDDYRSPSAKVWSGMLTDARKYSALVDQMDAIPVNVYLLGKSVVSRDIASFATLARALRTVYPKKPLIAVAWGAYHTNWNPAHSVFSDSVTQQYAEMIRTDFDGAFIWGPAEDNMKLFSAFSSADNRRRLAPPSRDTSELPVTEPIVIDRPGRITVGEEIGTITDTGNDGLLA